MVQAVLERNRQEIGLAMPMSSRRNTVGNSSHAYPNHSSSSLSEVANTSLQLSPVSKNCLSLLFIRLFRAHRLQQHLSQKSNQEEQLKVFPSFLLLLLICTTVDLPEGVGKGGVSHKIQQLLNTLKRPKKIRRPIEEYFRDDIEGGGE